MQQAIRRPDPSATAPWPHQRPNGNGAVLEKDMSTQDSTNRRASLELDKKGAKAKDLSHVPCKFHKQGSCQAGKSCPFSHDLTVPGTTKPICQWYAKGNCKFGHKCALAHILPGQPMSFDRKNKRAAQAAMREAQNAGQDGAPPMSPPKILSTSTSHSSDASPPPSHGSGIARSLKNSLDMGRPSIIAPSHNAWNVAPGEPSNGATTNGHHVDAHPSDGVRATALEFSPAQHPIPSTSTLNPTATFIPAPSGLSQGRLTQQLGGTNGIGRSSVAAQVMLSQQGRRLSSSSDSLSPSRRPQQSRHADSFIGSSPPLAVPLPSTNGAGGSSSIFGTSPFSGSRALFMPSSYDSNDEAFSRSPPNRGGVAEQMRRTSSSGWDSQNGGFFGASVEEDALDDDADSEYEEGFLPSSLNELLTPEEQRRRANRMGSLFDPFQNSKSVPAELTLARGRPTAPVSSTSAWGESSMMTIKASSSPLAHPRSYLAVGSPPRPLDSNSLHSHLLSHNHNTNGNVPGLYSASFDPSSGFGVRYPQSGFPEPGIRGQPLPAPGSLPGGLAAGLSQLHLIPADHTGDTPPVGSPFGTTAPPSTASLSPPGPKSVWNGAPLSWSSSNSVDLPPSPQGFTLASTGSNGGISNLKLPSLAPRRLSANNVPHTMSQGSSPLHQAVGPGQYEEDINLQFDMD